MERAGLIPISTVLSAALIGTGTLSPLRLAGATLVGLGVVLGLRTPTGDRL